MTNPSATNSRNKWVPRHARPAAGAAFCPAGAGKQSVHERKPAPGSIRGGYRFALGKHVKKRLLPVMAGSVFLAKPGAARYQVRAFSAYLQEAPAWSAAIAQLVEHVIRNDGVTGSNPVCGTSNKSNKHAGFLHFHRSHHRGAYPNYVIQM